MTNKKTMSDPYVSRVPTLLEAAKNFIRNVMLVGATPLAREYAKQLRAAIEREETRHKETP